MLLLGIAALIIALVYLFKNTGAIFHSLKAVENTGLILIARGVGYSLLFLMFVLLLFLFIVMQQWN